MDRHIYRARDKYTDKWVYGYYVCVSNERNNYAAQADFWEAVKNGWKYQ